jgi:uncharacterized membrane protein YphA (DoxX/SURF4 family)
MDERTSMSVEQVDSDSRSGATGGVLPTARTLGKGLAALRVFMGVLLFANGLAKLLGFSRIQVGPYVANLIDRDATRFILEFEVFQNKAGGQDGTGIPGLRSVARLMLDNWGLFGWAITVMELAVGALLILGVLTRLAALVGLGQQLFLALVYASSDRWAFEQPHEYVPLIILALVPAGRVWGLDGRLLRRRGTDPGELRGWPF